MTLPIPSTAPQTPSALQYTGLQRARHGDRRCALPVALVPVLELAGAVAGVLADLEHRRDEDLDLDGLGTRGGGAGRRSATGRTAATTDGSANQRRAAGPEWIEAWNGSLTNKLEQRERATHSPILLASYSAPAGGAARRTHRPCLPPMPAACPPRPRPTPIANGLVYVNPRCRAGAACATARRSATGTPRAAGCATTRDRAHPAPRDSAGLHRGLDLPARQRPSAGHRARRARPQAIPLPRRLAHAQGRGQVRPARGFRPRAAAHPRARGARPGTGTARQQAAPAREAVLAAIVRLLDTTYLRVGNEEYASSNGSFGLTTLRNRHAAVRGSALRLRFRGKSGIDARSRGRRPAHRADRAPMPASCRGRSCSSTSGEDGAPRGVSSTDVNDYLRDAAGEDFTAKDFRTWHGTVQALELTRLACSENAAAASARYGAKEILGAVARQLGNTPAVCKKAYVHPAVLALGSQLSSDAEAIAAIWERLAGTRASAPAACGRSAAAGFSAPAAARSGKERASAPCRARSRRGSPCLRPARAARPHRWPASAVRGARRPSARWPRSHRLRCRPCRGRTGRRRPRLRCGWRAARARSRADGSARRAAGSAAWGRRPQRLARAPVCSSAGSMSKAMPPSSKGVRSRPAHCRTSSVRVMLSPRHRELPVAQRADAVDHADDLLVDRGDPLLAQRRDRCPAPPPGA